MPRSGHLLGCLHSHFPLECPSERKRGRQMPTVHSGLVAVLLLTCGGGLHGVPMPGVAALATGAHRTVAEEQLNPIRKIVRLLQQMKKRVEHEGAKEQKLLDKYMCFCSDGLENLKQSITLTKVKGPQVAGRLEGAKNRQSTLETELQSSKEEKGTLERKLAEAEKIRSREAERYKEEAEEDSASLSAMRKAIQSLEGGTKPADSFLQADTEALRRLSQSTTLVGEARDALASVLDGKFEGNGDGVGEIVGILTEIQKGLEKSSAAAKSAEDEAEKEFKQVTEATEREIQALQAAIETKVVRIGKLKVEIVDTQDDLEGTSRTMSGDSTFSEDIKKTCETIKTTFGQHMAMRSEEMITISKTIEVLSDDKTLKLFKNRQGGDASFLQVKALSGKHHKDKKRKEALRLLRMAKAASRSKKGAKLNLIMLALQSKSKGDSFKKVVDTVNNMIVLLRQEQKGDNKKREYCKAELRKGEQQLEQLGKDNADRRNTIKNDEDTLTTIEEEIQVLVKSTKRLDSAMEDSKVQREGNHKAYMEVLMANRASLEILNVVMTQLMKFYQPGQSVKTGAANEAEAAQPMINANQFGPGAMAIVRGMTSFLQEDQEGSEDLDDDDDDAGEPDQGKVSSMVVQLLGRLQAEVERDTKEVELEEQNHKAAFELMRKDSLETRKDMTETLLKKQAVKANMKQSVHKLKGHTTGAMKQEASTQQFLQDMHPECDDLLKNYDTRKISRRTEADALRRAVDVLSGAG